MAVTKNQRLMASIALSVAFFILGDEPKAGAQSGTSFSLETARATERGYHPERGEVLLRQLGAVGATRPQLPLDPHLSIFVSDVETTSQIKLSEVMDQLVRQGGDRSLTKLALFHQWWDTAGQAPGLGLGPHCDDESAPQPPSEIADNTAVSTRNGFPYRCPRLEVGEASTDPFADESAPAGYSAIAFSNRFDLIGADAPDPKRPWRMLTPDCGEYRIVFARNSGKPKQSVDPKAGLNRNLIIFEARVPNPEPESGVKGCRPILDFWHGLSDKTISAAARGKLLHDFYLKGLPSRHVGPVVDIAHYTFGTGQIRTNQFMHNDSAAKPPVDWTLREFKTVVESDGRLRIVPDTVKTNPGNDLFRSGSVDPRAASLTSDIRAQIGKLLGAAGAAKGTGDINSIGFAVSVATTNAFESDEKDADRVKLGDVSAAFLGGVNGTMPNPALSASIQDALTAAGSNLSTTNIVNRIRTQTCAGCHHYSGNPNDGAPADLGGGAIWPDKATGDTTHPKMDFTQESERDDDLQSAIVGTGKRYAISSAVEAFLVYREAFMKKALGLP
jgi:hypothetical protein